MATTGFTGTLAIVGGTGALGYALATRAARAGIEVQIGSRSVDKACAAAERLRAQVPGCRVEGADYRTAAEEADLVAVTVPFAHQLNVLAQIREELKGKILIDTTVPLMPPKVARVQMPPEGSAAVRAQAFLGDQSDVVAAFHNVAAAQLFGNISPDCDILVFGDRKSSRETILQLISAFGMKGWHGGPLANAAAAEALTSVLIFINKTYGPGHAGIRVTLSTDGSVPS